MGYRDSIIELAPPWLASTNGGKLLRTFGAVLDSLALQLKDGVKARLPVYAPTDALPLIGRDRSLEQGPNETNTNFRDRLIGAVAAQRKRGSGAELLRQLAAHLAGRGNPGMRLVSNSEVWHEYDWATGEAARAVSSGDWSWDALTSRWHRGWVIVEGIGETNPSYRAVASGGNSTGANPTVSIAAIAGDLLVVFCSAAANTNNAPTCTDDAGGTYYLVDSLAYGASAHRLSVFVREKIVIEAATVVVTIAVGTNTSVQASVIAVAGVGRGGAGVVRTLGVQENQAGGTTPAPVLSASAVTTNMTITAVGEAGGVSGVSAIKPASWTSRMDDGEALAALEVATRDSGFTSTTVTWASSATYAYASIAIEITSQWCRPPGTFGAAGGVFDDGALLGCTGVSEVEITSLQRVVQRWKPANVHANRIIVPFNRYVFERMYGPMDPALLTLTGYWKDNVWTGAASRGTSAAHTLGGSATSAGGSFDTHTGADFNGSSHYKWSSGAGYDMLDVVSTTGYFIQIVFNADTAGSTNANPTLEERLLSGENDSLYITFTTSGVRAGHDVGGVNVTTPYLACSTGANHVVQVWYDGTKIWIRLDGGVPASVAAGAPTDLVGRMLLIATDDSSNRFFDGKISQVLMAQTPFNNTQRISLRALAEDEYATVAHPNTGDNPGGDYDDPANWLVDAVFFPSGGEEPSS